MSAPLLGAAGGDAAATLFELGVVLLALAVLGRFAARVGLSPIPFYLVAGLALGEGGVWELPASEEFITTGAQVGVVLLLLMLGLEYSADELTESLKVSLRPGVVDLVANGLPGLLAGFLLGWDPLAAFALAGITYISSSGIIAKLLGDLDRTANRETPVVLSLLVIEDLVMAVYLPVLAGLLVGGGLVATGVSVAVALVAVAVVMAVALRYGEHLSRIVFSHSDEVLLFSILGITLAVAGVAEEVKVSAAVGAFLVGLAVSGDAAHQAERLLIPLRDLFAAVFFLFFGIGIDVATLGSAVVPALALAVVTALTKVGTGWWAARQVGVGRPGRFRAGTVLVARGEFSIVVAGLVVAGGGEPELQTLAAAYVLILGVVGPVLTKYSDPLVARLAPPPAAPGRSR